MKKTTKLLLVLALTVPAFQLANAQMTFFKSELSVANYKADNLKFWDLPINVDAQVSLVDNYFRKNHESRLRFGDALGILGGVGVGKVKQYQSGEDNNKWKMLVDIGYSYGAFVGYKTPVVGLYYKYQIEKYVTYSSRTYTNYSLQSAINTFVIVIKDKYHLEYAKGTGIAKNDITDNDALNHFEFRSYFDDEGEGMKSFAGFSVDLWEKTSAGTVIDNVNVISFVGGFTF